MDERVAIVTGGSSGIGRETCIALGEIGVRVVAVGRDFERLTATVERVRKSRAKQDDVAVGLALDVRVPDDMQRMADETVRRLGRIDILVSCAGLLRPAGVGVRAFDKIPLDEWRTVLDTNLSGTFFSNRAVLPHMMNRRSGDIINVSSKSGRKGLAFDGPYCASKFGVIGLTQALAEEVRRYGIRVQAVLPGTFETQVWTQRGLLPPPRHLPPGRRVADWIVHLLNQPMDTVVEAPMIEPAQTPARSGWLGQAS